MVRQRNYRAAGAIYRTEAERLLSDGRKDELTGIYLEFANRYFDGIPDKNPGAAQKPDYKQALTYYQQALSLNPSRRNRQQIELRIANKEIRYDIKKQELLGQSLKPNADNKIKIRILADWGQLEVFANNGIYSYSEQFAFTPDDSSLHLYANGGDVKLVSMEFHEIARTWPGKAN